MLSVDIVGAHLNEFIEREVYMKFNKIESKLLCELNNVSIKFVCDIINSLHILNQINFKHE